MDVDRLQRNTDLGRSRAEVEQIIITIWQELLEIDEIKTNDNFFELGGDSLLAIQVISRIQSSLSIGLPLPTFFERPTVLALAEQIKVNLYNNQRIEVPPILPLSQRTNVPLSFAQQRLWFLEQLEPGTSAYHIPIAYHLQGLLSPASLYWSIQQLIQRHEGLRTHFVVLDGEPTQVIVPSLTLPLPVIDLGTLSPAQQDTTVSTLIAQEVRVPFDLAHGPLLRTTLVRLHEQEQILLLTMHHIISDGWSMGIVRQELAVLYQCALAEQPSSLPDLLIQYADYALWQRQWLQGEVLQRQLDYWQHQLTGLTPLDLPTDFPRPAQQRFQGASQSLVVSPEVSQRLKELSQQEGVTLFMTLLAAFQVLLARYSGQQDIVVGSPIANRTHVETEGLIGFFVNTLVLRSDLSGNPSFYNLLTRVREVCLGAYAHQDLPFEKLVATLQPERDLSRHPLFQVFFVLQNMSLPTTQLTGIKMHYLPIDSEAAKFDLSLTLVERNQELIGQVEYNRDLFEPATIDRMVTHFQLLLENLVNHPALPLSQHPLLTPEERQHQLLNWNATQVDYGQEHCIHELFEEQVNRSPEAIAFISEEEQLTYGALNRRANQVAHYLRKLGVRLEVRVGIYIQRSLELMIALLGVLKAGGAYVPLDPNTPSERLTFLLADAQPAVLLTQRERLEQIPSDVAHRLDLDTIWQHRAQHSQDNLGMTATLDNLAYVIYTSGSTGTPKGVLGSHRAMLNRFAWMWQNYPFTPYDVCCQNTSLGFVDSIWEIFGPLLQGCLEILIPDVVLKDLPRLIEYLARYNVTRIVLVPSFLKMLLAIMNDRHYQLPQLKFWVTSGEALDLDLVEQFWRLLPKSRLFNLYGASEVAADVTYYESTPSLQTLMSIPIGSPIANTQIYLLDHWFQPVPPGCLGELYVGGANLARGYLGHPELTAERFLPNPFSQQEGARLYRTGDQGRYRPDGTLEYLGRLDRQVKLRGYRIELGEIEAILSKYPTVSQSVAVLWQDPSHNARLVAYIVPNRQHTITPKELRQHLQQRVPDYMVPTAFVLLEALPLTLSGKLDRGALPAPEQSRALLDELFVSPRTPNEEVLAEVWAHILGIEQVGLHDNFFALGGHSLLATQVLSRIYGLFQVEIPLRSFFETPTVSGLATYLETALHGAQDLDRPPLLPASRQTAYPLSFAQERLWFLEQLTPGTSAYHISVAYHLQGPLFPAALNWSIHQLVQRHEGLRTHFVVLDGKPAQVIVPSLTLPLPMIDLETLSLAQQSATVSTLMAQETRIPFDLACGSLLRTALVRLHEQEQILLLTMHHIISDGWSMGIVRQELTVLYQCALAGQPSSLPDLPIQYADYTLWQRQWLQGEVLQRQLDYWQHQLTGLTPLDLPTDFPRPAQQTFRGSQQPFQLSPQLTHQLKALSHSLDSTLFMTLVASFKLLLFLWSEQSDLVVGTVTANRGQQETEGIIGCFMNFLALRSHLSGEMTGYQLFEQLKQTTLDAYLHQECPFEKVVEALQLEHRLDRNPVYTVAFLLQNYARRTASPSPNQQKPFPGQPPATSTSLLDLRLIVQETAESIVGVCEYATDLFEPQTIDLLLAAYTNLLEQVVHAPEQELKHYHLTESLAAQTRRARARLQKQKQQISLAATFTAEPLQEALAHWVQELCLPSTITFAPYNQVFQELLNPTSLLSMNQNGCNILLIRFEDWQCFEGASGRLIETKSEQAMLDFLQAIREMRQRIATPTLICICPASPRIEQQTSQREMLKRMEDRLAANLAKINDVYVTTSTELQILYPVPQIHDTYADKEAHIPFTSLFFAALSTLLARKISALYRPPLKVIVADCDQTLWQGVCSEDGALGVVIDPQRQMLQEFLVAQQEAGILLCLCSKNNEQDVFEVFMQRQEMPLKLSHFVSWRINWQDKAQNLQELAQELQLPLESFLFIDDNPLECAAVQSRYPEVFILPLPSDLQLLPHMLQHYWPLDRLYTTQEDQQRHTFYQEEHQRQAFQQKALTYKEFITDLELQVQISPVGKHQLRRAAQLTQRTNQFNFTTRRRTESDILHFCQEGHGECLGVEVSDRFGTYGLVGLILFTSDRNSITVDTFLLSCRVLGRGVEHRMLAHLGTLALGREVEHIYISFFPTAKNIPAREFLECVGKNSKRQGDHSLIFDFPAKEAAETIFTPSVEQPPLVDDRQDNQDHKLSTGRVSTTQGKLDTNNALFLKIASDVRTAEHVLQTIGVKRPAPLARQETLGAPRTPIEHILTEIWANLLNLEHVGIYENFFALGGHSLLAIQVLSQVFVVTNVEIPLHDLFEAPTISALAERITQVSLGNQAMEYTPLPSSLWQERGRMEQEDVVTGIVPLTLTQNWALTTKNARYQSFFLEYTHKIDLSMLTEAIKRMQLRHDILRVRFMKESNVWQQVIPYPDDTVPLTRISLATYSRQEHPALIRKAATALYEELDNYEGLLIRFIYFEGENIHPDLLLVIIHHLIYDYYSGVIFFDELNKIYQSIQTKKPLHLSPKPPSFKQFAEEIAQYTQSYLIQELEEYWLSLPWEKLKSLPADYPEEYTLHHTTSAWSYLYKSWSPEETSELLQMIASTHFPLLDILLAALALTIVQWTNGPYVHIITTDVGRSTFGSMLNLDLSHTIGYMAVNRRLFLDIRDTQSKHDAFQMIRNQLNSIPHNGLGSDLIHYSSLNNEYIRKKIEASMWSKEHILLNFLGIRSNSISEATHWKFSREYQDVDLRWESSSFIEHPNNLMAEPKVYQALYYEGVITNDQLHFKLGFDETIYKQETVERIYEDFKRNLKEILF